MSGQTKFQSWVETLVSTAIGFVVALVAQAVLFPMYGFHVTHSQNVKLTVAFTAISIIRGYGVRRLFNWWNRR